MNLSRPFVNRPVASSMIAVALVLIGALAYGLLPVSPLPQVDFPSIRVSASLPGASPETMAASVAAPLERALGAIAGVTNIYSDSRQGQTSIMLEFALGKNIDSAAREVQAAINSARGQLPAGMPGNPTFRKSNSALAPIMALALSSKNLSPAALYDVAATILAQKISQISGVGEVTLGGSSLPAVRVQLNPNALAHHGIALDEVRRAINTTNSLRPRGTVEDGERQWEIQISNSQLRKAEEYKSLVIRYQDGAPVRLSDVANVFDSVENRFSMAFHNDRPAVLLEISRQPGANIIETIDAINGQLPALRALMPVDSDLAVVMDRSPGIRATLHESQKTLIIAAALVMLVVFLFLGSARASMIPCLAIPVSVVGTFGIMYLYGFSLNNLSLMALIVAAGLVVDDAIVVLENITRHIEGGLSPFKAAMRGSGEVGFTLLAMNLSLMAVFISILFMGGLVERLFREFCITLVAAMGVSLVISLTLTPTLCARWLVHKEAAPPGPFRRKAEAVYERVKSFYSVSLDWVLRHATLTLIVLIGTIALNISLYIKTPKGFLPTQDTGQLGGFVKGDGALSYQLMTPKIEEMRRFLLKDPAVQDVMGSTGTYGVQSAKMNIRLKPLRERKVSAQDVVNRLRTDAPVMSGGSLFTYVSQDLDQQRSSDQGSYDLAVMTDDLVTLRKWLPKISEALLDRPELVDVETRPEGGTSRVMLQIDREAARRLGVDMALITGVLNDSFSQRQVSTLYDNLNQYRVIMEVDPRYTADPVMLDQVMVIAADGSRVPLSAFTKYNFSLMEDRVRHKSQFASENIGFALSPGVSLEEGLIAIDQAMAGILLPNDVQVKLSGSAQTFQRSLDAQPLLILGVLVAVYLVLGILYESLVHPLTILSTLPSAGLGALLVLRLTNTEFSLIALLGMFLLIGIVMKNAILMIDFAIATERRNELPPKEAIFEAAVLRLRPILMTNFAALLGALPLVLAMGEGVEMRRPLGLTIVGGLAMSQLLTLYSVPVVYLWLDRVRLRFRRRQGKPETDTGSVIVRPT